MNNSLTAQQVFDHVVNHLRQQKVRSVTRMYFPDNSPSDGNDNLTVGSNINYQDNCSYRTPYGLKCAIGCLITDEEYRPEMEGCSNINSLLDAEIAPASLKERLLPHKQLLMALQTIHDGRPPESWEKHLSYYAERSQLNYSAPETK